MFEKEADLHASIMAWDEDVDTWETIAERSYLKGAELGYNKANEWHNVADGDLPKDSNKVVLCICGGGFINGKINYVCRLLTRKEFSLFGTVYRWKEIVLPELKESE